MIRKSRSIVAPVVDREREPSRNSHIAQAMHLVAAQTGCTDDQALILLEERARSVGLGVEEIALAVVEHHIRFN